MPGALSPLPATLRCPTCRAVQEWSDTCRRCKCDLRLLRSVADAYQAEYARCLVELELGRTAAGLAAARRCLQLWPRPESHQLLAVCALLHGDWPTALDAARRALAAPA
jgi:hypothetical protein